MHDNKRSKSLTIWLTSKEFEQIQTQVLTSNCRHLSIYARQVLLLQPVTFFYRNASLDALMEELSVLKPRLDWLLSTLEKGHYPLQPALEDTLNRLEHLLLKIADEWLQ